MSEEIAADTEGGATALEHLTGPSRGKMTWLSGADLDITLNAKRFLHISATRAGEPPLNLIARLHRAGDSYELVAHEDSPIWVNGVRVDSRKLEQRDMIEFGETGPLSRYRIFREDSPVRKMASDILRDGIVYLRVSRRPFVRRTIMAFFGTLGGLAGQTTLLFRAVVILAIIGLLGFAYYQSQLNVSLQQRIEKGANRLEGFASTLSRTREEALTPGGLTSLRQELRHRLSTNAERLAALERRSQASARVIAESLSSIVFLQGAYGFRETSSGRPLRHVADDEGRPLISPFGQPQLTLEGDGPVAERQFTGSGFAVGTQGAIVTNRHVARPWENDANVAGLAAQGLEPVMIKYLAYAPGKAAAAAVELVRAGEDADLAVLRRTELGETAPGLKLASAPPAPGDEIIVMGYPTGLRSMLAQSGADFVEELQKTEDIGFWSVAARLAENGYIAPLASRGIVGQVTSVTIVYDAETTHGGSGGPVIDINGAVVAVNAAILPEYGGSNLGVPIAKVRALLEAAGLD